MGDHPRRIDVWEYVIYDRVLKSRTVFNVWGFPVVEYYYDKEVVGERVVEFLNDSVVAVEERNGVKNVRQSR
jgi:hypothetical protein